MNTSVTACHQSADTKFSRLLSPNPKSTGGGAGLWRPKPTVLLQRHTSKSRKDSQTAKVKRFHIIEGGQRSDPKSLRTYWTQSKSSRIHCVTPEHHLKPWLRLSDVDLSGLFHLYMTFLLIVTTEPARFFTGISNRCRARRRQLIEAFRPTTVRVYRRLLLD